MRRVSIVFIVLVSMASGAFAKDRIREFFEWGEYDSLLTVIDRYFSDRTAQKDPAITCAYLSYRGVAYFAKGNIAEARSQFHKAVECKEDLMLDEHYVTPEMLNLFFDAKTEARQERLRARQEDSLRIAGENARNELERKKKLAASIRSSFWKHTGIAMGLFAATIVLGTLAGQEYSAGRKDYERYNTAAEQGDKAAYEHYQSVLQKRNRFITAYSLGSAMSGCIGAYFVYKSIKLYSSKISPVLVGGNYGVTMAMCF